MFGYRKELELAGVAVDSYKRIMNTFEHKNTVINSMLDNSMLDTQKNVEFLGSYLIFDRKNQDKLEKYYKDENGMPDTEGEFYETVKSKLVSKIRRSKKEYMFFALGSIIYTNDVSHHLMFMLKREEDQIKIKVFNSGLYYLSETYGDSLEALVKDVVLSLNKKPVVYNYFIGMSRFGLFNQKSNPQDYCRGGILGTLLSYCHHKYAVHNESYCQTWCILMVFYEFEMMDRDYKFEENYIKNWSTDQKELEISIRKFILWIVSNFEDKINFKQEFMNALPSPYTEYKDMKFSKILENSFQTLHKEIEIPNTWKVY